MLIFGCATLPESYTPIGHDFVANSTDTDCRHLLDDISKKWGYHKEFTSCYYFNQRLINAIANPCTEFDTMYAKNYLRFIMSDGRATKVKFITVATLN